MSSVGSGERKSWPAFSARFLIAGAVSLLLLVGSLEAQNQAPSSDRAPLRILFIGNSYTHFNKLPYMLQQLAAAGRKDVETIAINPSGATLELHWNQGEALALLQGKRWDYVVLQEQSTRPLDDVETMHKYMRLFLAEVEKAGAQPILYLTWARQKLPETQKGLNRAYMSIASEFHASIAPVGIAWQNALKQRPSLELYAADGSHPSPAGSYLAACVFYGLIFHRSPEGLPARIADAEDAPKHVVNLKQSTATFLQKVAWRTVESFKGN
jgi:hypothetical protein